METGRWSELQREERGCRHVPWEKRTMKSTLYCDMKVMWRKGDYGGLHGGIRGWVAGNG